MLDLLGGAAPVIAAGLARLLEPHGRTEGGSEAGRRGGR